MDYLNFWGKAQPIGAVAWHPLAYHGLDVAATVTAYLQKRPKLLERLSRRLRLTTADTLRLVQFLAAVHDLGKFSYQFQSKAEHVFGLLFPTLKRRAETESHAALGLGALVDWLLEEIYVDVLDESALHCLANAACGHHGKPETRGGNLGPVRSTAHDFLRAMRDLFKPAWPDVETRATDIKKASWTIAGILAQCDWVGSSQHYFPYTEPRYSPSEYFAIALERAQLAVAELRLGGAAPETKTDFKRLFPTFTAPTPLQQYCNNVELDGNGPKLFILEDETGSGKTEAALTLAARLLAKGYGEGVLMALPSQTTADALFSRLVPLARKFFGSKETPSLVLAHGSAKLSLSRLTQTRPDLGSISEELRSWAQDSSKTALLADFGVATIDQVAMSALATKHTAMRQLGLAGKVLIVDEVHACEPYMLGLLEHVMMKQAAQGDSVVLLSATLPEAAKTKLIKAFQRGLDVVAPLTLAAHYPLATCVSRTDFEQATLAAARDPRRLQLKPISEAAAYALIEHWLNEGKSVGLFKNTVASAQEAYRYFAVRSPGRVTLAHARFSAKHRGENDAALLRRFGPKSGAETRRGQLIISTQVGEQSLDIDFDECASDHAPLDALLQRFGRRRRHPRDEAGNRSDVEQRLDSPVYVIMPDPKSDRFLDELPFGTTLVYDMPAVLHRTAQVIADQRGVDIPHGVRAAVDFAYREEEVAAALQQQEDRAHGRRLAEVSQARMNILNFEEGYDPAAGQFSDHAASVTRLGSESLRVVLCNEAGRPLFGDAHESSINLRAGLIALKPDANGEFRLNLSNDAADRWSAEASDLKGNNVTVRYSRSEGFSIERQASKPRG